MLCQHVNGGSIKMYKIGVKRMFSVFNADLELFIPVFHERDILNKKKRIHSLHGMEVCLWA